MSPRDETRNWWGMGDKVVVVMVDVGEVRKQVDIFKGGRPRTHTYRRREDWETREACTGRAFSATRLWER